MNDFTGAVIGIIFVMVVLFFICRELICWYYKINRIVSLLEDQIRLLKLQITFIATHSIKALTDEDGVHLRLKPSPEADTSEKLANGTKVQFIDKSSNEAELNGIKGTWFKIITQEKTDGWCFSGNLEKI
jgi:uncharacterized protein YgiM (DUF1202 family)